MKRNLVNLALYVLTFTLASCAAPNQMSAYEREGALQMVDIVNLAVKTNKTIVIYPAFIGGAEQDLRWSSVDGSKSIAMLGKEKSDINVLKGFSSYAYYLVDPGTYYLKEAAVDIHKTSHVTYSKSKPIHNESIGLVQISNTAFTETFVESQWREAHNRYEDVTRCTGVWANGYGQVLPGCATSSTREELVQKNPAGWYPTRVKRQVDGLTIKGIFNAKNSPLKFDAVAGEMLLIDGIKLKEHANGDAERAKYFGDVQTYNWDGNSCQKSSTSEWRCLLTQYSFVVVSDGKYFMNDMTKGLQKMGWTEKMLSNVHYRPLHNAMPKIKSYGSNWELFQKNN